MRLKGIVIYFKLDIFIFSYLFKAIKFPTVVEDIEILEVNACFKYCFYLTEILFKHQAECLK